MAGHVVEPWTLRGENVPVAKTRGIAGELVARELIARRDDLDVSTHLLAWHYHWSYAEIINLPISRRRRFIELVTEALHAGTG